MTMKTQTMVLNLWVAAGLLLAGGCGGVALVGGGAVTGEFHQTYPLAADGQVSVGNVNGSVRISAWDRAEAQVDAIKRARNEEDLAALKVEVTSQPGRLAIRTKHPQRRRWWGGGSTSGSVDYTVKVPATVRLQDVAQVNGTVEIDGVLGEVKASTVNGAVSAKGLAGNAALSTVNGSVKAGFAGLERVKSVSASSVNGAVELELPPGANADVSASTVNGGISGDVPVKKNWPVGAEVNTRLGEGGTRVHLSTVNGGVRIRLAKAQ